MVSPNLRMVNPMPPQREPGQAGVRSKCRNDETERLRLVVELP